MFFIKKLKRLYKKRINRLRIKYENKIKQERTKYSSILNHDIKTPLLAQIQSLKLILQGAFGEISPEVADILKDNLSSNKFMYDVISNAIFLSNFENNKPNLRLECIEINKIVEEVCRNLKNLADEKHQTITIKANSNITLKADRILVNKLIYNLVISSLSYGFENSNIEIFLEENNNSVSFCAKNKSIYMTKERINNLFQDRKNSVDLNQLGMSLNLNVARKVIDVHKWDIMANSNEDNSAILGFVAVK